MAAAGASDADLELQAMEMASKALPASLPEAARKAKIPAIKQKILERLKAQRAAAAKAPPPASAPGAPGAPPAPPGVRPPGAPVMPGAAPTPAPAPPPPPPPSEEHLGAKHVKGIELCGDEPWFADSIVRKRLRESIADAHKEQKIMVGNPAAEINRICPEDGRVLGAGAVLRLGGAHLGGYSENDVGYAYRQLSRALHPDKNQGVPRAHNAFQRLSEAADELRRGLEEQRAALRKLVGAMGGQATPAMLERPQEALFAEACRFLSAVVGLTGEGEVPKPALSRATSSFARSGTYYHCQTNNLLSEWFERNQMLELYASPPVRTAYDCATKRHRAQFLCLLNRAAIVEAKRFNDCVRGTWPIIIQVFPELGLWRELRDAIHRRVWDTTGEPIEDLPAQDLYGNIIPEEKKRSRSRSRRRRSRSRDGGRRRRGFQDGPDQADRGRERAGSRLSAQEKQRDSVWDSRWNTSDDPNFDPNESKKKEEDKRNIGRDRKQAIQGHPHTGLRVCKWGRRWRGAMAAVLPSSLNPAAPHTDFEVRKLGAALWKDIVKWLRGTDLERVFGLFKADTQTATTFGWDGKAGEVVAPRGLDPETKACEWAFVPVVDLILTVGEGLVGSTVEGMFASNPIGHTRLELVTCYKDSEYRRKRKEQKEQEAKLAKEKEKEKENEARSKNRESGRFRRKTEGSKWDQAPGEA